MGLTYKTYYKKKTISDSLKHKLDDNQVNEIKELKGQVNQMVIAERFGITQGYVSLIQRCKYRNEYD